jgi:DNA-binding transcriptional regulator YdaS (Cro superfamily)
MNLDEYLKQAAGALSPAQLAESIGVDPAQVRQWQIGSRDRTRKGARQPSAGYAMALEIATGGKVRRWDSRPNDWHEIWLDLIGSPGAPPVPAKPAKAA